MITVSRLGAVSKGIADDLSKLASELHGTPQKSALAALKDLKELSKNPHASVVVAKDGKRVVGMAMLFTMQKVGKRVASVEDVVVLSEYRGKGIGEKLMRGILIEAKRRKLHSLSLTSRPTRVAANKLYKKLGFKRKETNAYKLAF